MYQHFKIGLVLRKQSNVIWRRKSDNYKNNEEVATEKNAEYQDNVVVMINSNHNCCVHKNDNSDNEARCGGVASLNEIRSGMFWTLVERWPSAYLLGLGHRGTHGMSLRLEVEKEEYEIEAEG
ncbi:hypothetical protein QYF36_000746 [Acer negundo]|nr:hypothetical protein QYF36_000746 [Acer negundo]